MVKAPMTQTLPRFAALGLLGIALCFLTLQLTPGEPRLRTAQKLEQLGRVDEANKLYRAILDESPCELEALRALSANLMIAGAWDAALPYQQMLIALDPYDSQTRVELAFNYNNHQDSPSLGLKYMREAVYIDPSPRNLTFLAQMYKSSGRVQESRIVLTNAIAKHPEYAYAKHVLSLYTLDR